MRKERVVRHRSYDFFGFVAFFAVILLLTINIAYIQQTFTGNVVSPGESITTRWNSDPQHPAPHAIDHDYSTYYMACLPHVSAERYQQGYLMYALGKSPRQFQNISLSFAKLPTAPEPAGYPCVYTLSISNDHAIWTTIYEHIECENTTNGALNLHLNRPISAKYLNLTYFSLDEPRNCIAVKEFRVF